MQTNHWCKHCENSGWLTVPAYINAPEDFRSTPVNFNADNPLHCFHIQVKCPYCELAKVKFLEESESIENT